MPTVTPERAEQLVSSWLTSTEPVDGIEHPAGPLFLGGYAESEITMTGPPGGFTMGMGCCLCTGSVDGGIIIHCC